MRKLQLLCASGNNSFTFFVFIFLLFKKSPPFHMTILSLSQAAGRKDVLLLRLQVSSR